VAALLGYLKRPQISDYTPAGRQAEEGGEEGGDVVEN